MSRRSARHHARHHKVLSLSGLATSRTSETSAVSPHRIAKAAAMRMSALALSGHACRAVDVRFRGAGSTGRRNTGVKFLCRGFKSQGLAWPLIELACPFVEMGLRVDRQVGSFRKIQSQQTIGVFVGTALPWTFRIVKVNMYVGP